MRKHPFSILLLIFTVIIFLLPLWLLVSQALIPSFDAMLVTLFAEPVRLVPVPLASEQFHLLFARRADLPGIICRDTLYCLLSSAVQVLVSVICGYMLAKYRSRFTKRTVLLYTMTLVLPMQMFLIPVYRITEWVGAAGDPLFICLMAAFSPLGAILMRQVFLKMPDEWAECFRMEDTRMSRMLLHIVFPAGLPAACILFLFSFVEMWSMIEQPLLLITDKARYPLSMLLFDMRTKEPDVIFAASLVALAPAVILLLAGTAVFVICHHHAIRNNGTGITEPDLNQK